jgi:hypothetical protein
MQLKNDVADVKPLSTQSHYPQVHEGLKPCNVQSLDAILPFQLYASDSQSFAEGMSQVKQ